MTFNDLRQLIYDAFMNTIYPGDEHIVGGFSPPLMPEPREVYNLYHGKSWKEKEADSKFCYSEGYATPTFLSPEAFRYYLPAYMIAMSNPKWNWDTEWLSDNFLYYLHNKNKYSYKFCELSKLTNTQAQCVAFFLNYLVSNEEQYGDLAIEALVILDDYWKKFLPIDESNTEKKE
jgi:hypothetical protein